MNLKMLRSGERRQLIILSNKHNLAAVCIIALSASIAGAEEEAPRHTFFKKNCVKCKKA
jgi:hypothetical protein